MSVTFRNVNTNEVRVITNPHHIGAFLNSSDLGTNSNKGQDFGWRLDFDMVDKLDDLAGNPTALDELSRRIGVPVDELTQIHLLNHLSHLEDTEKASVERRAAREPKYKQEYEDTIRKRRAAKSVTVKSETTSAPVVVNSTPANTKKK